MSQETPIVEGILVTPTDLATSKSQDIAKKRELLQLRLMNDDPYQTNMLKLFTGKNSLSKATRRLLDNCFLTATHLPDLEPVKGNYSGLTMTTEFNRIEGDSLLKELKEEYRQIGFAIAENQFSNYLFMRIIRLQLASNVEVKDEYMVVVNLLLAFDYQNICDGTFEETFPNKIKKMKK